MTNIYLHGLIAKEFGPRFKMSLGRSKDAMYAIDANRNGFIQRLIDLANKGFHYSMIVDGAVLNKCSLERSRPKEIHILPTIIGSAGVATAIGVVLYVAAATAPEWAVGILLALGTATLSYGISNLTQKDQKTDVGSASATSNALNKSFLFSNGENIAEQGIPVPIGYGRLRIGSAVIQSTIKSYPAKFDENNSLPIYSEFVELATKRGLSQMSIISRQQQDIAAPV